ncbi:MAG: ABC transporter ATP-binding protein [Xenococcaceae cyanobacterium]
MLIQQFYSKLKPSKSKTSAITAKGLEMVFQSGSNRFPVLKGIDLSIPSGDIQLLMGPSGSGKTTLLSILAGLIKPTAGSLHLLGQDITRMSRKELSWFRLQNIGFIFQGFNLFPALSVAENVELALNIKGIRGKNARHQTQILLESVGLADKAKSLPHDLSGGQKQRVAIARALAGNPRLIMADEPTAALDSYNGQAIVELLHQLASERGSTVLIVTHDPRIMNVSDYILYLEDGQLKPKATMETDIQYSGIFLERV